MNHLLDAVCELRQNVFRNIVNVLSSQEAFADLLDDKKTSTRVADKAIAHVLQQAAILDDWQFHYTTAIGYPFETDHFMASRYSDGTFPIWYASLDSETALHETIHHFIKEIMAIEGIDKNKAIIRERVVYGVFCQGVLIDLTKKKEIYPELMADHYGYTQKIGKQLSEQGYPGLLVPSARYQNGINATIFKQSILLNPIIHTKLTYRLFPSQKKVVVYQKNQIVNEITYNE